MLILGGEDFRKYESFDSELSFLASFQEVKTKKK